MSKFGTFGDYPKDSLASAEKVLLTAWPSLERYHDDLVLVGGLAVHYLTKRNVAGLPGAVTMDVDFGISLAASGEQYGTIKTDLAGMDFKSEGNRLQKDFSDPDHDGPIRAEEFHPGNADDRNRVRQDVATVGKFLLGG